MARTIPLHYMQYIYPSSFGPVNPMVSFPKMPFDKKQVA